MFLIGLIFVVVVAGKFSGCNKSSESAVALIVSKLFVRRALGRLFLFDSYHRKLKRDSLFLITEQGYFVKFDGFR
jgi:hypothetical protein